MKLSLIRLATVFIIITVLCLSVLCHYIATNPNTHSNAVLVIAQENRR